MQLTVPAARGAVASRLRSAACVLLAAAAPATARADAAAPTWQFDASGLYYSESARTHILEPQAKITRLFANGATLSAQVELDAMSGASPTGALPTDKAVIQQAPQTSTSASGGGSSGTYNPYAVPTAAFHDFRGALDLAWSQPAGPLTFATSGHVSHEHDYRSVGGHEQVSLDLFRHRVTLTAGGGRNADVVAPIGGFQQPLALWDVSRAKPPATALGSAQDKTVTDGLGGVSFVVTRRWLVGVNAARTHEDGFLTEPYKIVSLFDRANRDSLSTQWALTEKRPSVRNRNSVFLASTYHLETDILYSSYRYYQDDWGIRSHTLDLKYRYELPAHDWLMPHLRWYQQTHADFYTPGLVLQDAQARRLPEYASADQRLGDLRTLTLGLTYGVRRDDVPGDLTLRAEYLRQWGDGHPASLSSYPIAAIDVFPSENVFTLMAGYTLAF